MFLQIIGVIAVASSVIPWILIPVIPLLIAFLFLRRYFLRTSRDVKRIESTSKCLHFSLVFSNVSSEHLCCVSCKSSLVLTCLFLQLEVLCFHICHLHCKASGPSVPLKLRKGFSKRLMPIRICTRVSKGEGHLQDSD